MDLKIKKYYIAGGNPGGGTDDEQGDGSTVESKFLVIDSKFRRETSNFKVKFDASNVDPESEAPVLIKYIEKNLKPEELLGTVVTTSTSIHSGHTDYSSSDICNVYTIINGDLVAYNLVTVVDLIASIGTGAVPMGTLYYVPSTGALSMNGPYVEGGETEGRVIDLTKLQYDSSTKVYSGYETGLGVNDFEGAKIIDAGDPIAVRLVNTSSREDGFTIRLQADTPPLWYYNPTTGQFTLNRVSSQQTQ